jgi:predicted Zn-dependent protease
VRRTLARAAEYPRASAPPISRDRSDFVKRFEGILVGPDPAQGIFRDELFLHPDLDFALKFPRGWQTQNSPQAVMAKPAQGAAIVALIAVPKNEGADARGAAQRMLGEAARQNVPAEDGGSVRVGAAGARGYRVRALSQGQLIERTYFMHGGGVFALHTQTYQQQADAWADAFDRTLHSFRTLTPDDRACPRRRARRSSRSRAAATTRGAPPRLRSTTVCAGTRSSRADSSSRSRRSGRTRGGRPRRVNEASEVVNA